MALTKEDAVMICLLYTSNMMGQAYTETAAAVCKAGNTYYWVVLFGA